MTDTPSATDLLIEARAALLTSGWRQHGYGYGIDGRPVCAVGAICCALKQRGLITDSYIAEARNHEAYAYLTRAAGLESHCTVETWNDKGGRTLNEVLDVYDKAIWNAQEGIDS